MHKPVIVSAKIQNQKVKENEEKKWQLRKKNADSLIQQICLKIVADGAEIVNFTNVNTAQHLNPLLEFADKFLEQYKLQMPKLIAKNKQEQEEYARMKKFRDKYKTMWEQFKSDQKSSLRPPKLENQIQEPQEPEFVHIDLKERMPDIEFQIQQEEQVPEILEIEEKIKSKFCSEVKPEQLKPVIEKYECYDPQLGCIERERIIFPELQEINFEKLFREESASSLKSKQIGQQNIPRLTECSQQIKNELQLQPQIFTPAPKRQPRWEDTAHDNYQPTDYDSNESSNNKYHRYEWRPDPEYNNGLKDALEQQSVVKNKQQEYSINNSPRKQQRLFQNGKIVPKWAESMKKLQEKKVEQSKIDHNTIFGRQVKPTVIRNEFFNQVRGSSSKWIVSSQPQKKENKFDLNKVLKENQPKQDYKFLTQSKENAKSKSPIQGLQASKPIIGGVGGIVQSFKKIFNKFSSNKKQYKY